MIFYFSGSGNSYFTADYVAQYTNDKLVSIADCLNKREFNFELEEKESLGFVFPIHFWGIPYIVSEFIENLHIDTISNHNYVWICFTCGGATGNAQSMIKKQLKQRSIDISAYFACTLIDIFVPFFSIPPKAKQDKVISQAKSDIKVIAGHINERDHGDFNKAKWFFPSFFTLFFYPFYNYYRNTCKFKVSDKCIACKKCENICPTKTIEITDKPIWKNNKCTLCFACLHICPVQAIDYGRICMFWTSKNKGRYRNPQAKKDFE